MKKTNSGRFFEDYRLGAFTFSKQMIEALKRMVAGEEVTEGNSGMTKREWREMMAALDQ